MKETVWLEKKEYERQQMKLDDCIMRLSIIKDRLDKAILLEIKMKEKDEL